MNITEKKYTSKDFISDQELKWCPGCGDYSILKQMQMVLPEIGIAKENIVFVSGIGCSSRFPYYMDTFGLHGIHGRAPSIATGIKLARPELSVWIITGDGDALSIGGNHTIHLFRRNLDVNVLLFNNEIYGLTKGQYSPTSSLGLKTKSSPLGAIDQPFNPLRLALGAQATFIARSIDRDPKHLREMLLKCYQHKGTSFLEIYQNCNIFNDGAFEVFSEKASKPDSTLFLEHGKPLLFGAERTKGIRLDGLQPEVVSLKEKYSLEDLWVHDEKDCTKANILARFFDTPGKGCFPRPFGVLYTEGRPCYDVLFHQQFGEFKTSLDVPNLDELLAGTNTWMIS
ncbi:MAG: 2-oxoacid:ferredoxin oxidoreductase subunit beta [Flavobacteriales bacterium AspAUS03]